MCFWIKQILKSKQSSILSLELPPNNAPVSIQQVVDNHFKEETVEEYDCVHCRKKHDISKKIEIEESAKYVFIHLNRFEQSGFDETFVARKKSNLVDLSRPLVLSSAHGQSAYKLVATVNHDGSSPTNGHYYSDILKGQQVVRCDDHGVKTVLGFDGKGAYILLFERLPAHKVRQIIKAFNEEQKRQKEQQSMDVDGEHEEKAKKPNKKRTICDVIGDLEISPAKKQKVKGSAAVKLTSKRKQRKQTIFQLTSKASLKKKIPCGLSKKLLEKLQMKQQKTKSKVSVQEFWELQNDLYKRDITIDHFESWKQSGIIVKLNNVVFDDSFFKKNPRYPAASISKKQKKAVRQKRYSKTEGGKKALSKASAKYRSSQNGKQKRKKAVVTYFGSKNGKKARDRAVHTFRVNKQLQPLTESEEEAWKSTQQQLASRLCEKDLLCLTADELGLLFKSSVAGSKRDVIIKKKVSNAIVRFVQTHKEFFEEVCEDQKLVEKKCKELVNELLALKVIDVEVLNEVKRSKLKVHGFAWNSLVSVNRLKTTEVKNLSQWELEKLFGLSEKAGGIVGQYLNNDFCGFLFLLRLLYSKTVKKSKWQTKKVMNKYELCGEKVSSLLQRLQEGIEHFGSNTTEDKRVYGRLEHAQYFNAEIQRLSELLCSDDVKDVFADVDKSCENLEEEIEQMVEEDEEFQASSQKGTLKDCLFAKEGLRSFTKAMDNLKIEMCDCCHEAVPRKKSDIKFWPNQQSKNAQKLCPVCYKSKKEGKIPLFSAENGMIPKIPPAFVQTLTPAELNLCKPFLTIWHVADKTNNPFQQRKFRGNVISYPQDITPIAKSLPRRPDKAGILLVRGYNSGGNTKEWKVSRSKCREFIKYLQKLPIREFQQIKLDEDWII